MYAYRFLQGLELVRFSKTSCSVITKTLRAFSKKYNEVLLQPYTVMCLQVKKC